MSTEQQTTAEQEPEQGQAVHAAGIAYLAGGRLLMIKRGAGSSHAGTWAFPAGGIEEGETPKQAAARESDEEVSHKPDGDLAKIHDGDGFALFLCQCDQFLPMLNEESDGYVWASPDDLPKPLHPGVDDQVKAVLAHAQTKAQDATAMDKSAREVDINGWPEIKGNPLSKVGVYPYGGSQLPGAPDPQARYMVYRPADELASPECLASFRLLPWIDNHVMLGSEENGLTPAEKKGVQGVIGEDVYFKDGTLFGNLKVFSQSLANLIEAGKRELSCGYRCTYEWSSGTFEGQPYDVIQRRIRGNHLALVESGRMGPEVSVLDGSALDQFTFTIDSKEINMAEELNEGGGSSMTLEQALEAIKQVLPAIKMIQEHTNPTTPAAEPAAADPALASVDGDKEDPKPGEPATGAPAGDPVKADPEEKKGEGMDAESMFKTFVAKVSRRDALAAKLSGHIGTFDHSLMTEQEVAVYGAKKLGLTVKAEDAAAALTGYLAAKGAAPHQERVVKAAMDSSSGDNFVTRHLKKGA